MPAAAPGADASAAAMAARQRNTFQVGNCFHCGKPGHHSRDCPKMLAEADQAELVIRQNHSTATAWGIVLDNKLRLKQPSVGFPVADSEEYKQLIGWTLIGINGAPIKNHQQAMEILGKLARPRSELKLHCRSPLPEDDVQLRKINRPCSDWLRGKCHWGDQCKFLHQKEADPDLPPAGKGGKKGKVVASCYQCGKPGHTTRDCDRWHQYQSVKDQQAEAKKSSAPCHPIGMSAAEAAADQMVALMQQHQAQKRQREEWDPTYDPEVEMSDGGDRALSQLQDLREELRQAKEELTRTKLDNETLRQRCVDAERHILDGQRHQQHLEAGCEDKLEKKVEKMKKKVEKAKEDQRERNMSDKEKMQSAIRKGLMAANDVEAGLLANQKALLTAADAWALLGLDAASSTPEAAREKANELMEEYNPDRVQLEICKVGLSRRRAVAEQTITLICGS
eukprot:TRINITY_DN521_c0_g1_i1.p1 TRINITY_DN521_c0_g1~~TRINITY_DN521_c0_g1_i1.p1  ORF type:complete len:451 (+),score=182.01 TRINITY_DN521_c0_g1_i1:109-1461(+)